MAGDDRFDASELATVRQRRADIEAQIENLLDNITATNRDYVDRRISKLKDELAELEQQEAALLERQGREYQAEELAQAALALAPQVTTNSRSMGRSRRSALSCRAFVHEIVFDPESRTGTAYFYAVPVLGGEDGPGGAGGTRYHQQHANLAPDERKGPSEPASSLPIRNVGTRYTQKRTAPGEGGSSLIMVAGQDA